MDLKQIIKDCRDSKKYEAVFISGENFVSVDLAKPGSKDMSCAIQGHVENGEIYITDFQYENGERQ